MKHSVLYTYILTLASLLGFSTNSQAQCLEYSSPYLNMYNEGAGAALCAENCESVVGGLSFQVWPNDVYFVDALYPGAEYNFNICEDYDPERWKAVITAVVFKLNGPETTILDDEVLAWVNGCDLSFTVPKTYETPVDVAFIVTEQDSCGVEKPPFLDNGFIKFTCGPAGGHPPCPKRQVSCRESVTGEAVADTITCFGDLLTISVEDLDMPTEGDLYGFACIVSSEDISFSEEPNREESYLGIIDTVVTEVENFRWQHTITNDGTELGFGDYYITPIVFGNAIRREPGDRFRDFLLLDNCTKAGASIPISLKPEEDEVCSQNCKKLRDGSLESGSPNSVWEESSTNFGSPICDGSCSEGTSFAIDGEWWAWFGGKDDGEEEGTLKQTVNFGNAASASLTFYLALIIDPEPDRGAEPTGDDRFEVSMDGDVLFSITDLDYEAYEVYEVVDIDLTAYLDGCDHELQLMGYTKSKLGEYTNFFVDDLEILACSNTCGANAGSLDTPTTSSFDTSSPFVVGYKESPSGDCFNYLYIVVDDSEEQGIVSTNDSGDFDLEDFNGTYYLYGLSYNAEPSELSLSTNQTLGDLAAFLGESSICYDFIPTEKAFEFSVVPVGLEDGISAQGLQLHQLYIDGSSLYLDYQTSTNSNSTTFSLYDLNGQRLLTRKLSPANNRQQENILLQQAIPQGMYIGVLQDSNGREAFEKVIVE